MIRAYRSLSKTDITRCPSLKSPFTYRGRRIHQSSDIKSLIKGYLQDNGLLPPGMGATCKLFVAQGDTRRGHNPRELLITPPGPGVVVCATPPQNNLYAVGERGIRVLTYR